MLHNGLGGLICSSSLSYGRSQHRANAEWSREDADLGFGSRDRNPLLCICLACAWDWLYVVMNHDNIPVFHPVSSFSHIDTQLMNWAGRETGLARKSTSHMPSIYIDQDDHAI